MQGITAKTRQILFFGLVNNISPFLNGFIPFIPVIPVKRPLVFFL